MKDLPTSVSTMRQLRTFTKKLKNGHKFVVTVKYDDSCGNGHNTFSITAMDYTRLGRCVADGCMHEEIARQFPELAYLLKWHLVSSVFPLYHLADTLYWKREGNSKMVRSCAVWPDMPDSFMDLDNLVFSLLLEDRLPVVMQEFKMAMESQGFVY